MPAVSFGRRGAVSPAFVVLAVLGYATLWMAVAADMGASLLMGANGLRTLQIAGDPAAQARPQPVSSQPVKSRPLGLAPH